MTTLDKRCGLSLITHYEPTSYREFFFIYAYIKEKKLPCIIWRHVNLNFQLNIAV